MSRDIAKENRRLRHELVERRRIADESSARRQALSEESSGFKSPDQRNSKLNGMKRKDKDTVTRNLNDTFQFEEDDYEPEEQLTQAKALIAAKTYLRYAQTREKEEAHCNTVRALKLVSEALAVSAPKKAPARRRTREESLGGDPSSPDDDDYRRGCDHDDRNKNCGRDDRDKDRRCDDR